MSLRNYISLMLLATIACYLALFAVLYFFDPFSGGVFALLFLYASLFLSLIGTFSILGLLIRLVFTKDKLVFKKVIISFRQAIWFAFLVVISLHLRSIDLFAFKNILFLIFALGLLELFFMSYKAKPSLKI
jgi:hypothetical protein